MNFGCRLYEPRINSACGRVMSSGNPVIVIACGHNSTSIEMWDIHSNLMTTSVDHNCSGIETILSNFQNLDSQHLALAVENDWGNDKIIYFNLVEGFIQDDFHLFEYFNIRSAVVAPGGFGCKKLTKTYIYIGID